jgi:site-specific DNA-methyltransferase (adenine-specific)
MENPNLYLGDCRDFVKTLGSSSVDLIVTDPPYGINYISNRQTVDRKKSVHGEGSIVCRPHYFGNIENDKHILTDWIAGAYRVLKSNGAMYVFTHWSRWSETCNTCEDIGFSVKNMIVLNKSNHGMGDLKGSYAPKHELLLFAAKDKHQLRFPEGRENDIWNVPVKFSGSHRFHPNEKPLSWLIPAIANSSDEGQVVLDLFMGSGSTGVACVEMSRKFIGAEQDANYFRIAQERITEAVHKRNNDVF